MYAFKFFTDLHDSRDDYMYRVEAPTTYLDLHFPEYETSVTQTIDYLTKNKEIYVFNTEHSDRVLNVLSMENAKNFYGKVTALDIISIPDDAYVIKMARLADFIICRTEAILKWVATKSFPHVSKVFFIRDCLSFTPLPTWNRAGQYRRLQPKFGWIGSPRAVGSLYRWLEQVGGDAPIACMSKAIIQHPKAVYVPFNQSLKDDFLRKMDVLLFSPVPDKYGSDIELIELMAAKRFIYCNEPLKGTQYEHLQEYVIQTDSLVFARKDWWAKIPLRNTFHNEAHKKVVRDRMGINSSWLWAEFGEAALAFAGRKKNK